jgi:hypothetical protein
MQAFMAACEDGIVAWHSNPSIAYRPSLVCLFLSERNKLTEVKIMFSVHKAGILKIHHTKHTFLMQYYIYIYTLFSGVEMELHLQEREVEKEKYQQNFIWHLQ